MNPSIPPSTPAVLYGRVSTDKQDMERQDRMLADYCGRNALASILYLKDPDVSASIPFNDRENGALTLAELRRLSAAGPVAFVTTEQDRIGRDTIDQIHTLRVIWELGAIPHFTAEGGAIPRTPENELRIELRASVAQYERNKIRQRIRSKMATKRDFGELCGTCSYGFQVQYTFTDGHQFTSPSALPSTGPHDALTPLIGLHGLLLRQIILDYPEEQQWLLHMDRLRAAGWSYYSIAKDLNARGVPTKRRGEILRLLHGSRRKTDVQSKFAAGKWQQGNVAKVLNNLTVRTWLAKQTQSTQQAA